MAGNLAGSSDRYFEKLSKAITHVDREAFDRGVSMVSDAWQRDAQIITLGNGGSSMTALHYITDWNKSIFLRGKRPFRGRTLIDNMGLVFAYANDISFESVFEEQLKSCLVSGDLVVALSGSGNSKNVLRAVEYANEHGAVTLGLCGYDGGKLMGIVQHAIWIEAHDMQICEDLHAVFGHVVMQSLCGMLQPTG